MNKFEVLETPIKSEGDKKNYRLIKLPNGLKALLIMKNEAEDGESSENGEDIAAAQLTVNIGSFDDPPKAMGLAHFLEHMVHMGSEKYPVENSFSSFLVANGGNNNATTSSEYTSYHFQVAEKAFPEALYIFAQQFISPLLHKNAMQREREAVDSEYQMATSNDFILIENIYKSLIHKTHPASQFDCGNLKSLKEDINDDDLNYELKRLHAKYVGSKMYLAVQSKRSLDKLQEIIVKCFSGVRRSDEIFEPKFYDKIYYMKPKTSRKSLILTWTLPSIRKFYKCSPFEYISQVFENDEEGGLSYYLKNTLLITYIYFYVHKSSFGGNSLFCLPRIMVELTDKGLENIEKILESIFSFLLMLKETSIEDHRRAYNESRESSEVDFKFFTEKDALKNVRSVTTPMAEFEDRDVLRGNSIYQDFDESIVSYCINAINEKKFNLMIVNDKHESFSKREKHFGAEYDEQDFPEAYQKLWDERKLNPSFFLEKPNPFKAKNFEIFTKEDEFSKYPKNVYADEIYEVWHKLDNKFKAPRAAITLQFISPKFMSSLKNYVYLIIYNAMLDRQFRRSLSQASSVGLFFQTSASEKGISFSFTGFNDKMESLFTKAMEGLKEFNGQMDESIFEAFRVAKKQASFNKVVEYNTLSAELFKETINEDYHNVLEMYKIFDSLSFQDFQNFVTKFFEKMKTQILVQGNMTKSQAMDILRIVQANFRFEPLDEEYKRKRGFKLPHGTNILRVKSLMTDNDNSNIRNYYQIGRDTLRARCLTRLIVMILDPKAFDYLRSKEQLGYSVGCQFTDIGNVLGLIIHVSSQEGKNEFTKVYSKMETFMTEIARKAIEELTDEEFENYKESRVKLLLSDAKSLSEETSRNWSEIKTLDYVFDRNELAGNITKNLTKAELQDFFKSFTLPENVRKLSVQVIGKQMSEGNDVASGGDLKLEFLADELTEGENLISDIEDFHCKLLLYPVPKFEI